MNSRLFSANPSVFIQPAFQARSFLYRLCTALPNSRRKVEDFKEASFEYARMKKLLRDQKISFRGNERHVAPNVERRVYKEQCIYRTEKSQRKKLLNIIMQEIKRGS